MGVRANPIINPSITSIVIPTGAKNTHEVRLIWKITNTATRTNNFTHTSNMHCRIAETISASRGKFIFTIIDLLLEIDLRGAFRPSKNICQSNVPVITKAGYGILVSSTLIMDALFNTMKSPAVAIAGRNAQMIPNTDWR